MIFVAKDGGFQAFAAEDWTQLLQAKSPTLKFSKAQFEEERVALGSENLVKTSTFCRVAALEGDVLGSYQHGARIGVLVAAKALTKSWLRQIAMHVAASKPEFIKPVDVPLKW